MTQSAFTRDGNFVPIDSLGLTASKAITYSTLTTGATGATTLFTVTGTVAIRVFALCSTDLTGAGATLEVGVSGNTASIISQTTGTTIDSGEFLSSNLTPASVLALPAIQLTATDVIQTIATNPVTGGVLTYYCVWVPISSDANVVSA